LGPTYTTNALKLLSLCLVLQNLFLNTVSSGEPIQGTPGLEGMGTIAQGYQEMSNVEIVDELVNMIIAQRAYETNSRAIRAANEMLRDVINVGR